MKKWYNINLANTNGDGSLFDEAHPRYVQAALAALHTLNPQATLLELNTGAMARGYRKAAYPAKVLLQEWKKMGGKIILTSDAHSAQGICFGYAQAAKLALSVGYLESVSLSKRGILPCSLTAWT